MSTHKVEVVTPTQRSLAYCRDRGWPTAIQEHWNPHAHIRQDLWGCIDLLALDGEPGVLAVQACAGSSHANRAAKVRDTIAGVTRGSVTALTKKAAANKAKALQRWLEKGNRIEVWSWSKRGPRGKRKTWELRTENIAYERTASSTS